jgi:superoxide dismutase, Cu-Zn family
MKLPRSSMPLAAPFLALWIGCGGSATPAEAPPEPPPAPTPEAPPAAGEAAPPAAAESASAAEAKPEGGPLEIPIEARSDSSLTGTATFSEEGDGVKVVLKIGNAPPGLKGAHIHEKGDCSAKDGSSAGDHFNPDGHKHARPPDEPRHLGDLGNIGITPEGVGALEIVVKGANLKPGDPKSFLDRAVIIHGKKDDGGQPTGNAGPRIGCGVIKRK